MQKAIIKRMHASVLRDYLATIMEPLVGFGRNCFKVQLGQGEFSEIVIGMFHICVIGGDGKEKDGLCGVSPAKQCFCRMCLENRRALFTYPSKQAKLRCDSYHEQLAYDLLVVDNKRIQGDGRNQAGKRKRYVKTDEDLATIAAGDSCSIIAGDNRVYELFYGLNCLKIAGMHSSAWPDLLHVVLKGIVEKTLGNLLVLVIGIQKLFPLTHHQAMATLDQRVGTMVPIDVDWMRWVSFTNGLSQLLKVDTPGKEGYSGGKQGKHIMRLYRFNDFIFFQ